MTDDEIREIRNDYGDMLHAEYLPQQKLKQAQLCRHIPNLLREIRSRGERIKELEAELEELEAPVYHRTQRVPRGWDELEEPDDDA